MNTDFNIYRIQIRKSLFTQLHPLCIVRCPIYDCTHPMYFVRSNILFNSNAIDGFSSTNTFCRIICAFKFVFAFVIPHTYDKKCFVENVLCVEKIIVSLCTFAKAKREKADSIETSLQFSSQNFFQQSILTIFFF